MTDEQARRERIKELTYAPVLPALMDVLLDDYRDAIVAACEARWVLFRTSQGEKIAELTAKLVVLREDFEEREAACCPENVGFERYIAALEKKLAVLEVDKARLDWMEKSRVHCPNKYVAVMFLPSPSVREAIDAAHTPSPEEK